MALIAVSLAFTVGIDVGIHIRVRFVVVFVASGIRVYRLFSVGVRVVIVVTVVAIC